MPRKTKRSAATYPPQFLRLFMKVLDDGEDLVINTLENRRQAYTTARARLNEFRKLYHDEAQTKGNNHQYDIAQRMYAVTIQNPVQVDGKWQMTMTLRESKLGEAFDNILGEEADDVPADINLQEVPRDVHSSSNEREPLDTQGAIAIHDLMADNEENGND